MKSLIFLFLLSFTSACVSPQASHHNHPDITFKYLSHQLSELEPCGCTIKPLGGMGRLHNYLKKHHDVKPQPHEIRLAGGTSFVGENYKPEFKKYFQWKSKHVAKAYQAMGWKYLGIGKEDLGLGLTHLAQLEKDYNLTLLATNLGDKKGKPVVRQKMEIVRGGHKVLLLSLTEKSGLDPLGYQALDPIVSVKKQLEGISPHTLVVVLSSLSPKTRMKLTQQVPRVNVILGTDLADSGTNKAYLVGPSTLYIAPEHRGRGLSHLEIFAQAGTHWKFYDPTDAEYYKSLISEKTNQILELEKALQQNLSESLRKEHKKVSDQRETLQKFELDKTKTSAEFKGNSTDLDKSYDLPINEMHEMVKEFKKSLRDLEEKEN